MLALSFHNIIDSHLNLNNINKKQSNLFVLDISQNIKIGKKLFVPIYIRKRYESVKLIAFIDNGSNVSLIQSSYIQQLFNPNEIKDIIISKNNESINSYSNHSINVLYTIKIPISFKKFGKIQDINLLVIDDISNVPKFLIGTNILEAIFMSISYAGDYNNPIPEIHINLPEKLLLKSYYVSDFERYLIYTKKIIQPNSATHIKLYFNESAPCLLNEKILISSLYTDIPNLHLIPSQSKVMIDKYTGEFFCIALLINESNKIINENIYAIYEPLYNNYRTIPISKQNFHKLNNYMILSECSIKDKKCRKSINLLDNINLNTDIFCVKPNLFNINNNKDNNTEKINQNKNKYEKFSSKNDMNKFSNIKDTKFTPTDEMIRKQNMKDAIYKLEKQSRVISQEENESFNDKDKTLFFHQKPEISTENLEDIQSGMEIQQKFFKTPEEIINLDTFEKELQPFIKEIFLEKYPSLLARNSLDSGNLSQTLGSYNIRLKKGAVLPKYKKIFYLNPSDLAHLNDILEFMMAHKQIEKVEETNVNAHLYGSPSYLVSKTQPGSSARLVVDFSKLNDLILAAPPVIPNLFMTLNSLRNCVLFSSTDLTNAFNSLSITNQSKYLTSFTTPVGRFVFNVLPTGMSISPGVFSNIADKMIHYEPILNSKGEPEYISNNIVKLQYSPIPNVFIYFDDILIATTPKKSYKQTLEFHFQTLSKVMQRLHFHHAKISFEKTIFAKSQIKFLGWKIGNSFLQADESRIKKLQDFVFPSTKKGLRSFCGLINSLRSGLKFTTLEDIKYLTPLTSIKSEYSPTPFQRQIFEKLKSKLTQEPIYSKMISVESNKVIFSDASTGKDSSYSAVLAQIIDNNYQKDIVPSHLNLDDKCHRILFDFKLAFLPLPSQNFKELTKINKNPYFDKPPESAYLSTPYLGYEKDTVNDSLFLSIQNIQTASKCKITPVIELRKLSVKQLKSNIHYLHFSDDNFNSNKSKTNEFLMEFCNGQHTVDKNLLLVEALAHAISRHFIILDSRTDIEEKRVIHFNYNTARPPFILGLYEKENKIIFRPFYVDKDYIYDLTKHRNNFEVIVYYSKKIPSTKKSQPILDLELGAILQSLYSLAPYIGTSEITLITDSRPLFLLFSSEIQNSSVKFMRWSLKLKTDYKNLKFAFIPSNMNISDFLSKTFNVNPINAEKIGLHKYKTINDLDKMLPDKIWSIQEWDDFVKSHPNFLRTVSEDRNLNFMTASLEKITSNLTKQLQPYKILQQKFSSNQIAENQQTELKDLYNNCKTAKNMKYMDTKNNKEYHLINGIIFIIIENNPYIFIPPSMIGLILSYAHLTSAHGGYQKMKLALSPYYFDSKNIIIKEFASKCYSCILNNTTIKRQKLGQYPIMNFAFQSIHLDLIENLNKAGKYMHILVVCCPLSDYTCLFPLKDKTANKIADILLYSVLQYFNVMYIISDNAMAFNSKPFYSLLAALNITRVYTSSLNPKAKGLIESRVRIVKLTLRKLLVNYPTFDWQGLVYLVAKLLNTSSSNKIKYAPSEFLFGSTQNSKFLFEHETIAKLHPSIRSKSEYIKNLNNEIQEMTVQAKQSILSLREKQMEKLNSTKISKQFYQNQIVFVLDRGMTIGSSRPLKSKYSPSPFVIVEVKKVSALVRRISDDFTATYSFDDLKAFSEIEPKYLNLPSEIRNILKRNPIDYDNLDMENIMKHDYFPLPPLENVIQDKNIDNNQKNLKDTNDNENSEIDNHNTENIEINNEISDTNNQTNDNNEIIDDYSDDDSSDEPNSPNTDRSGESTNIRKVRYNLRPRVKVI